MKSFFLLPFLVDFASGAFSSYTVTHDTQNAGATGNVVIGFTVGNAIEDDGVIKFTFPSGIDLATATPAVVAQSSTIDGSIAASVAGQVLTLTRSGGADTGATAAITITVSNIGNPSSASAGGTSTLAAFAADGTTSTGDNAVTDVAAVPFYTALASTSVVPASLISNADSSVTIGFTTATTIPTQGVIKVTFPSNFDLATLTPAVSGTPSGVAGTWAPTVSSQTLTLTQASGGASTSAGAISFVITNIGNPTTSVGVSSGAFKIVTYQANGSTVLDWDDSVAAVNIYAGALSSASVTPASLVTNVDGSVTIGFTTATTIPTQGVIKVTFPTGFDLATLTPAVSGTPSGVAGTWAPTVSSQVLVLTQASGGASTSAGAISFVITNIGNPTSTGATGVFAIATYQAGGTVGIDHNVAVSAVTITATLGYSLTCVGNTDCTSARCVNSVCEPALCAVNQYVSAAVCTACATGTKSLVGHLSSGPDTTCSATCPVNSYANGSGNCVACATGYTNLAGDDPAGSATTCGECAANYYVANATTCTACAAGSHIAAGALSATATTCTNNTCTCTNGTAATAGSSACTTHNAEICASCSTGYALSGGLCKPSCSTAPSAVANTSGTLPSTLIGVDTTTITCAAGYNGAVTLTCAAGSTTYTAASTCAANTCTCTNGTAATGTACTADGTNICASCATNYTLQSGLCQPTCTTAPATASRPANTSGTYPSSLVGVDTTTITCATGWYNGGTAITLTCAAVAGTYTVSGTCAVCAANYYRSATGTCTACPTGQYRIAGATTVVSAEDCYAACPVNTYATGPLNARTCATCATGTSLTAGSSPLLGPSTSCDTCIANYYVNSSNVCTACAAGTTRPAGDDRTGAATACTATLCTANQYVSSNACVACPTGHTRPAGDDASGADTSCGVCAANYSVVDGVCTACATNTYRVAGDLISGLDTACTATCPENSYVSSGNCVACAAGTIKAAGGNPAGADTICDTCAANYYVTTAGVCTACAAGFNRASGDSNQGTISAATVCAANTCTCTNGTAATGTACTADGGEICASCSTGYALGPLNSCQLKCDAAPTAALPANTSGTKPATWTEGSTQPITCAAGYQGTITLACATAGGEYTVSGTCDSCAANYAVTSGACVACSATTSRAAGDLISGADTTCTLCALDHNVVGTTTGVCTPCAAGLGRPAGDDPTAGETTCSACRANFYMNNASTPVCTACPSAKPYRIAGDATAAAEDCGLRCKANQFAANGTCNACASGFSLGAGSNPATGGNAPACIADAGTTTAAPSSTTAAGSTTTAAGGDGSSTTAAPGTTCAANENVVSNACTACPEGKTRPAGDDPTGADTACNDPASAHFGGPSFFLAGLLVTAF